MLDKVRSYKDINQKLILGWKTPQIENILKSTQAEEMLLIAYENGLMETPNDPKITPREMIYALTARQNLSSTFKTEVRKLTQQWVDQTFATWNQNVTPFYAAEAEYILYKL